MFRVGNTNSQVDSCPHMRRCRYAIGCFAFRSLLRARDSAGQTGPLWRKRMSKLIRGLAATVTAVPLAVVAMLAAAAPAAAVDSGTPPAASTQSSAPAPTPPLGWSSWSFVRHDPTAAKIEAQADAMKSSGLAGVGFQYVNVDDFWYRCPGG